MKLCHLKIQHLRNISNQTFEPAPGCNLISGVNGAGKTTILEAIYLLARAKSFRTSKHRSPIQNGESQLTLFAEVEDESDYKHKLGLLRQGSSTQVRLDGNNLNKLSELAKILPVLLITPNSHRIIEEGPEHRRRLLNWGVFHVEHQFKTSIMDFNRALLQRNNALRKGSSDLRVWNQSFVDYGESVNRQQTRYFNSWKVELLKITAGIDFLQGLEVSLSRGWREDLSLLHHLEGKEASDRERGFTSVGPHRADINYKVDGEAAKQKLSRGQQKVLISSALIAQSKLQQLSNNTKPILLFDDMDSELDSRSLQFLLEKITMPSGQAMISTINPEKFSDLLSGTESGMFHVEHGRISRSS